MDKESFRLLFENCPEALIVSREGRVLLVNEEGQRLLGCKSSADFEGRRLEEIIPMDIGSRIGLHSSLGRLAAGDVRSYEWDLILPGSAYIPVQIRAAGLPGGTVLLSIRDATESSNRNRALAESEDQKLALIEASPSPVFGIDSDFRIQWASSSFGRTAGIPQTQELRGLRCHSLLAKSQAPCRGCPAAQAMNTRMLVASPVSTLDFEWSESATAVRDAEGAPIGALVFLIDKPHATDAGLREASAGAGHAVESGPAGPGTSAAPPSSPRASFEAKGIDLAAVLMRRSPELRGAFGEGLEVIQSAPSAPVPIRAEQLLDTLRRLAEADCGSCLGDDCGVIFRIDPAEAKSRLPGGLPVGKYVSLSVGSREILDRAASGEIDTGSLSFISSFPMGTAVRSADAPGAVYVSRSEDLSRFYRILLPEAQPGEVRTP